MMWDRIIPAYVALLEADAALIAALGGKHIYAAQASRPVRVPSVEYQVIDDRDGEAFNALLIQVDFWARGKAATATIARRLRALSHRDTARTLTEGDDPPVWLHSMRVTDSREHQYRAEPGVAHWSMDVRFEAGRAWAHMGPGFTT